MVVRVVAAPAAAAAASVRWSGPLDGSVGPGAGMSPLDEAVAAGAPAVELATAAAAISAATRAARGERELLPPRAELVARTKRGQ